MLMRRHIAIGALLVVIVYVLYMIWEIKINVIAASLHGFTYLAETRPESASLVETVALKKSVKINHPYAVVLTNKQDELNTLRLDGVTQRLSELKLDNMTYRQLSLTCHSYLDSANTVCKRKLRMGNVGDGGWEICDDPEIRPEPPCIIYSFGIGNDFSFDDEASRWYKCHVFSFDPTILLERHNRSNYVHFYNVGIGQTTHTDTHGWKLYTLSDIRAMLGHQKSRVHVIKMDVEGAEWDSVLEMVHSDQMSSVHQFLVEYHIHSLKFLDLLRYLKTLQALELAGFRIFYTHKNEGCGYRIKDYPPITSQCFEVHYRRQ